MFHGMFHGQLKNCRGEIKTICHTRYAIQYWINMGGGGVAGGKDLQQK